MANREVHCVISVDCFIKWMEECLLETKHVATLVNWFYIHLVAHFSKPKWVLVDQDWEFVGSFV